MNKAPIVAGKRVVPASAPSTSPSPIITSVTKFPEPAFTGSIGKTIIPEEFYGLNLITGFRGKGKTSYGLKVDRPDNILMLDCEDKGKTLAQQKKFKVGGYFQPLTDAITAMGDKFDIQGAYDRIIQIIEKAPVGRFTTLFIDNAQDLQDGGSRFIENNLALAKKYGVRPDNVISGGYGGALPGVKHLVANMLHLANSKDIKVVVVSFQLKPAWKDGKPLFNKWKMTDLTTWHERSVLTLALVDPLPQYFPIPSAFVMKESLSLMEWSEEQQRTVQVRRIPPRLPRAEPAFIYDYLKNPADMKNLKDEEKVEALDLDPYSPTFSKEQLILWERLARAQKDLGMSEEEQG